MENGFTRHVTSHGPATSIDRADDLHLAIAREIARRPGAPRGHQALDLVLDWSNLPRATGGMLAIMFNRAFVEAPPSMDEVAEARAAFAAGDLAWDELVAVYKRAGMVEEDVDPVALRTRIAQDLLVRTRLAAA